MGEIITYKNQAGGVFAQIKLDDGKRVLISLSTTVMNLKIFKLLWGSIPIKTVHESSLQEATNLFLKPEDWGKQGILLDKIIETLIDCRSINDIKDRIKLLKSGQMI